MAAPPCRSHQLEEGGDGSPGHGGRAELLPPSHRQRLEGVIGYFGGGAPSRTIPVFMRIE